LMPHLRLAGLETWDWGVRPVALWRCDRDWHDGLRTRWVATTDIDWLLEHGEILAVIR